MPKSRTAGMPRACARRASSTTWFMESWKIPGIEAMGFFTSSPAVTKIGYTKSSGESRVSRTRPRSPAVRLVLLSLCCGKANSLTPLRRVAREEVRDRLDEARYRVLGGFGVDAQTAFAGGAGRDRAYTNDPRP